MAKQDIRPEFLEKGLVALGPVVTNWRRRLWSCALMGGVPLLVGLATISGRYEGMIVTENAIKLSGVILLGCITAICLAFLVAVHILCQISIRKHLLINQRRLAQAIQDLKREA